MTTGISTNPAKTNNLYTGIATSTGEGRAGGRATSSDGELDLVLAAPKELGGRGGGTNPEQLFAAGWASCYHSALKAIAAARKLSIANSAIIVEVTLHNTEENGYSFSGDIHVELPGLDQETANTIAELAHATCPYSKLATGGMPVTLEVTVD